MTTSDRQRAKDSPLPTLGKSRPGKFQPSEEVSGSFYRRNHGKYFPLDAGPDGGPIYFQYYVEKNRRVRICLYTTDEKEARERIALFGIGQLPLDNLDLYLHAMTQIGEKARAMLDGRVQARAGTRRRPPPRHTRGTQ